MAMKYSSKHRWIPILALVPLVLALTVVGSQAKSKSNGYLGVYIQNIDKDLMESEDLPSTEGVLVTDVIEDSPAEKAGLERGDVILMYDGDAVSSTSRLTRLIERTDPGERKELTILHDGSRDKVTVEIGEEEENMDFSFYGDHNFHFTPDVPSPPKAYTFSLGDISTSSIGVSLYELSDQLAKHYGAEDGGALINEVMEDSPAAKAGLKAGDVIVKMDGKPVEDIDEIREAIQDKDEGETVAVTLLRDGEESNIDVAVEESNTWSGMGDNQFFSPRMNGIRGFHWAPQDGWSNDLRDNIRQSVRESIRGARETNDEWREEMQDAMDELRQELRDLKKELKEKGN